MVQKYLLYWYKSTNTDAADRITAHTIRPTDKGSMESFKKFFKVHISA
jgi:hypothetical protein